MPCPLRDNPLPQRVYPWGDEFVADYANAESNVGAVSTPGCFVKGRSPYDCEDMAGNVWEWTRSLWGKDWQKPEFGYPYVHASMAQRENLEAADDVFRVLRGGSWYGGANGARCAYRRGFVPGDRFSFIGIRVVLRSPLL